MCMCMFMLLHIAYNSACVILCVCLCMCVCVCVCLCVSYANRWYWAEVSSGGFRGGGKGRGPPFFFANALARGKSVAPCCIMRACACTSERVL